METTFIKKKILINLYFFIFSLFLTFLYLGKNNLSIYDFNWLFYGDASSDLINWLNFKNADWAFPFGTYKSGDLGNNSVVYTGAVPLLAIIFKTLFKNVNNFHFFNFWIFLCFYLQYLFSYLILKHFLKDNISSILGGLFFVLSPIFINKLGLHLSLGGHWILLAYFFIKLKNVENNKNIIIMICLSTLIHFYFTMMILFVEILHSIFIEKFFTKNKFVRFFKYYFYIFFFTLLTMYLSGYFAIPVQDTMGYGYGYYKLNILSIINPSGLTIHELFNWSNFLPTVELNFGEKEGFNYLGLGYLLMLILFISSFWIYKLEKINYGYVYIIILITLFSLSNNIDFGKINIINIQLNKYVEGSLSIARASGRFFWPVYYFILFCCLINLKKIFKYNYKIIIIFFLLVQIIDLLPGYKKYFNGGAINNNDLKIESKLWNKIISKNKILTSTYLKNHNSDYYKILPIAVNNNFNSEIQYFARYDRNSLINLRYKNYKRILNNNYELNKVYIVNNIGHANHIKNIFDSQGTHELIELDNIIMLVDKDLSKDLNLKKNIIDKIKSKKIESNFKYEPKFFEGSNKPSFLGIGWTKHGQTLSAVSDGNYSTLLFNLSGLKKAKYNLIIDIDAKINNLTQNISVKINDEYNFKKKIILNEKNKTFQLLIPVALDQIADSKNYMINFNTSGQITEFDVLKSPDRKKIGFKINYIKLQKL